MARIQTIPLSPRKDGLDLKFGQIAANRARITVHCRQWQTEEERQELSKNLGLGCRQYRNPASSLTVD
jgi:hypothetical protein